MNLSKRMQAVADAVSAGRSVADIGTDHGYVPIYLVETGRCQKALAMDINQGPLDRADAHIRENGLTDKIETRLSNGLEKLDPGEADSIVIAGMGGDLICRILEAASWLNPGSDNRPELILQPQAEWFKVRYWLEKHNYDLDKEWFLQDEGKYYVVMHAVSTDERPEPYENKEDYLYGKLLIDEKASVLKEYLLKEEDKKTHILQKLMSLPGQAERREELKEEMRLIEAALKRFY